MNLSTKGRYAVMALMDLAVSDAPAVALSEISKRQGLPLPYLEQLFGRLRRSGLVLSQRGTYGGYFLARPASEISIADIIYAMGDDLMITRCKNKASSGLGCLPNQSTCRAHRLWSSLETQVIHFLQNTSLEEACRPEGDFFTSQPSGMRR